MKGYYAFVVGEDGHITNRVEIMTSSAKQMLRLPDRAVARNTQDSDFLSLNDELDGI